MFEFVEQVVYINLEHRTDRKQQIESELLKYFPVEKVHRFNAVLEPNGGIGCTKSHIKVLEMAIENGWKNCLIVEDDAVWSDNFYIGHSLLEKLVNANSDVITLGITHASYTQQHKLMCGQTATAYLVNQHYYPKLLENFKEGLENFLKTGNYGVYALDQYWKRLQMTDNWGCVIPSIMVQKPSFSDIEKRFTNYIKEFS